MEARKKVIAFPKRKRKPAAWVLTPEKFLTDREYDRLLACVRERRDAALQRGSLTAVRDCALVIVLAKSGLRIGEAVSLIWSDLYLWSSDGKPPAVLVRRGKGGKSRLVPIGDDLRREMKLWKKSSQARGHSTGDGDLVFTSQRGGQLTVSAGERIVGNAMRKAGISGKRNPHRLRHTYGARVYRVSRDLRMVQKLLGHSRVDTSAIYAGLFAEDVKDTVERV